MATRTTNNSILNTNHFGVSGSQVRSNRFTKFTDKQLEAAKAAGVTAQLAKLYGVKEDELFTSSGKIIYKGPEHSRGILDKIQKMTPATFKKHEMALELLRVAVGWTERRIALARKQGAGPVRKGWAGVHAAKAAKVTPRRRSRAKKS